MGLAEYKKAWDKAYEGAHVEFGFNSVAGYTTGLVLEKMLSVTQSMDQLALRQAAFDLSGKLKTLDGTFERLSFEDFVPAVSEGVAFEGEFCRHGELEHSF